MSTLDNVVALPRNERDDKDLVDSLPATTRAVVCGFLSARAELYTLHAGLDTQTPDGAVQQSVAADAGWARERFVSMRDHPTFARLMPVVRERVERLINEAGACLYTLTPRQVATLAAA